MIQFKKAGLEPGLICGCWWTTSRPDAMRGLLVRGLWPYEENGSRLIEFDKQTG